MLATHAELDFRLGGTGTLNAFTHQGTHTVLVDCLERRDAEDAGIDVLGEEHAFHVIAREAPGGLGQVVRAE